LVIVVAAGRDNGGGAQKRAQGLASVSSEK
jgi:hypothetical protein